MTFKEFIKAYRAEIDMEIKTINPTARLNNEERRQWILNYEPLYRWAQSEGVKI